MKSSARSKAIPEARVGNGILPTSDNGPGRASFDRTTFLYTPYSAHSELEDLQVLKNLIPKIFYARLQDGLEFFVNGLGFEIQHQDDDLAVVTRDGAKAYIARNDDCAAMDRPELAIETDDIDALFEEMSARSHHFLHPNLKTVSLRPWGAREFAMRDSTSVCVVFREWPAKDPGA